MTGLRWTRPRPRLAVDLAILVLLCLTFSYWWLGNAVHEAAGTLFLILIMRHVVNNLMWWRGLGQAAWTPQRVMNLILGLALGLCTLLLTMTSLAVSRTLADILPIPRIFLLQEVHWFAAYWTIALAAMHLGVTWNRVMGLARSASGLRLRGGVLTVLSWVGVAALVWQGLRSGVVVGLWPRLIFRYSMAMWDFNASVLPFFLHWAAVIGCLAALAHLVLRVVSLFPIRPLPMRIH